MPEEYALPLVKMHWLFVIIVYIIQFRKEVRPELLDGVELGGRGWGDVVQKALGRGEGNGDGGEMEDAHYVKGMFSYYLLSKPLREEDGANGRERDSGESIEGFGTVVARSGRTLLEG